MDRRNSVGRPHRNTDNGLMISDIDAELEWLQQLIKLLYTRQYQVERDFIEILESNR